MLPILRMRFLSPPTISFAWFFTVKARCLLAANGPNSVSNVPAMEHSLNGFMTGVSLPRSRRKYTSRLFIIPAMRPAASWMACAWRMRLSASVSSSSSSALPPMAVSGVRSSWVTFWMRLRRNLISFSFALLLSCNFPMSCSRCFRSWSLRLISRWMARPERNSSTMAAEMVAVSSLTDSACASDMSCSRASNAACACVSRSRISRPSSLFSVRLRMRRLSAYASISAACFLCRAVRLSLKAWSSPADGSTCTVFLPPKKPASPLFFFLTVRTRVARRATSGRWFTSRLFASSCRSITSMMCRRWVSLSVRRERSVSICAGRTYSRQSGFMACSRLSVLRSWAW